jgi:hypothetical protein
LDRQAVVGVVRRGEAAGLAAGAMVFGACVKTPGVLCSASGATPTPNPMKTFLYVAGVLMIMLDMAGCLFGSISSMAPGGVGHLNLIDGMYVSLTFVMATICICSAAIIGAIERAASKKA